MARKLFILDDGAFARMPRAIQDHTVAEARKLFDFTFLSVARVPPAKLPAAIDFTDSIVKVVETDDEVSTMQNQANRGQIANIRHSVTQRRIGLTISAAQRAPATPERGGVGFQWKTVEAVGTDRVLIALTGGVASLETARSDVLTAFAGGRSKQEIIADRQRAINTTGAARYFATADSLKDTAALTTWNLERKALTDWSQEKQQAVGTALARLIAHEARHQYVLQHFSGGGLGADSAVLFGQKNFEQFDIADQHEIAATLDKFEIEQRRATVHLETFPAGQPSPWI
jgi:hypothetical protein